MTVVLDFIFHQSLTYPMEIPAYFAMKFVSALAIAYLLIPRIGLVRSAIVFTFWVDVYYGLFVVLLGVQGLSSSPNQIISILGIMNQLILLPLWTLVHGLFFWIGGYAAEHIEL